MIASSAFRCRVSSNSRAFSSATLMLPARVCSSRTSDSLNACSRSSSAGRSCPSPCAHDERDEQRRTWRLARDDARFPNRSAASLHVLVDRPAAPRLQHVLAEPVGRTGESSIRSPRSREVGVVHSSAARGGARCHVCASKISDLVADQVVDRLQLSSAATPCWTLLMSASSAFRCRVSSNSRAFSSATLRLPASVFSSWRSDSLKACSRSRFCSEITPVACRRR